MPYFFSRRNVLKPEEKALERHLRNARLAAGMCAVPQASLRPMDAEGFSAVPGVLPTRRLRRQAAVGTRGQADFAQESGFDKLGTTKDRRAVIKEIHDRIDSNKPVFFQELYVANPRQSKNVAARLARNPQLANNPKFAKQLQKKGGAGTAPTVTPKLLGGEEVSWADTPDPRVKLMEWLRRKDNPYFARAWVNRVWAAYFGVGIVDPPDDNEHGQPAQQRPLLDYLAQGSWPTATT